MHITDKQFALILEESDEDTNNIVYLLEASIQILKKYGQKTFMDEYMSIITEIDKNLGTFLISLKKAEKTKVASVRRIIRLLKSISKEYNHKYTIYSPKGTNIQEIEKFIHGSDAGQVVTEQTDTTQTEIVVKGEGKYYKRSAMVEAKKLLQ